MNNVDVLKAELEAEDMNGSKLFYNSKFLIKSPLGLLNAYLNGGFPSSSIVEVYGEPKAGKSTFTYMVGAAFQQDHKDGIIYIIDSEKSIERIRMERLGIDPKRVIVQSIEYLEQGFIKINKLLDKLTQLKESSGKKKKAGEDDGIPPVLIVWDTIAASVTQAQYENPGEQNKGGMTEKPRIIKKELSSLIPKLDTTGASLWLINQVYTHFHRFGAFTDSGGGFGLKHGAHYKIEVVLGKKYFGEDDEDFMSSDQISYINVKKTKSSPEIKRLPLVINTLEGGRIDHAKSILYFFKNFGLLEEPSKGWFTFPGLEKKTRLATLIRLTENLEVQVFLTNYFLYVVSKKSTYLRAVYFKQPDMTNEELDKWYKDLEKAISKLVTKLVKEAA